MTPTPTRNQVPGATRFNGGEGTWFDSGIVFLTTKGDRRVWAYDTVAQRLEVVYDREKAGDGSPLRAVDNVTVARSGDVYICEDGDNLEICLITPDRQVRVVPAPRRRGARGHRRPGNETVGVVFDPSGTRLYFGAQRSFGSGAVYEVSGPFRTEAGAPAGIVAGTVPAALAPTGEGTLRGADTIAPGVRAAPRAFHLGGAPGAPRPRGDLRARRAGPHRGAAALRGGERHGPPGDAGRRARARAAADPVHGAGRPRAAARAAHPARHARPRPARPGGQGHHGPPARHGPIERRTVSTVTASSIAVSGSPSATLTAASEPVRSSSSAISTP